MGFGSFMVETEEALHLNADGCNRDPGVGHIHLDIVVIAALEAVQEVAVANVALHGVPMYLPPAIAVATLVQ